MILFPNAKINLGLDIVSKRDDGYHDIVTCMLPIGWCDVLEIVPSANEETTLTLSGNHVACPPEKNLIMKAYRAMNERVELPPVDIYLRKIIPDGAGLGGGSADAAFTLIGLNRLFSLGYGEEDLADIASKLGADCPFFIYNRPMLCTGIGTDFSPINPDVEGFSIIVVKPDFGIPTAEAYSNVTPRQPSISIGEILGKKPKDWRKSLKNDFEESVTASHPRIAEIKEMLYDGGAVYASMSGSGSAVFGLFESDNLAEHMTEHFAGCAVYCGKL